MVLDYDYIICGGGASGLFLAENLSLDPYFAKKKILMARQILSSVWMEDYQVQI